MAGTPGRKLEGETEAEAMAEWCLLACSQVRSVWSLVLGPSYINQENAGIFAYRESDQGIFELMFLFPENSCLYLVDKKLTRTVNDGINIVLDGRLF